MASQEPQPNASSSTLIPISASSVDVDWLKEKVGRDDIVKVDVSKNKIQGMSGAQLLLVTCINDKSETILTTVLKARDESDKNLGLTRECHFYNDFQQEKLPGIRIPKVYFAAADEKTGGKAMLMEDLSNTIQAGYFYDPLQPNNFGKDLPTLTAESDLTMERITKAIFASAAQLHGTYWGKGNELCEEFKYLRGGPNWNELSWTGGQNYSIGMMKQEKVQTFFQDEKWNKLRAVVQKSQSLSEWKSYQEWSATTPQTLVHGDFHPANMVILPEANEGKNDSSETNQLRSDRQRCCFLDWEMIGIGSGPQEIAQYLISHATTEWRREHEQEIVEEYYNQLIAAAPSGTGDSFTLDLCWKEYIHGGLGKWIWFLPFLVSGFPTPAAAYFAQKILDFIEDHGITVENVSMPRFF